MRRGEVWTVAGGNDYAGKPRPVVIVQNDNFVSTDSITTCPLTTDSTGLPLFRLPISPSEYNGLRLPCYLMADKIITVPKTKMGRRIGRLHDNDVLQLNRAMLLFLDLGNALPISSATE